MRIQVNSDKNIVLDAQLGSLIRNNVNRVLNRFTRKLTRVEVHLSDVNSHKRGGLDKRCLVEARPAVGRPLTATHTAAKIEGAVNGALAKLQNSLQTFFGRLGNQRAAVARAFAPPRRTSKRARARGRTKTRILTRQRLRPRSHSAHKQKKSPHHASK